MSNNENTIMVTLAVGTLEIVKYHENKIAPKGPRARAVNDLIERSLKVCDLYRLEAWDKEQQAIASTVLDKIEAIVSAAFTPAKMVTRGTDGRFVAVGA
jgi:hypothetical protein